MEGVFVRGRAACITGAASGIGLAVAERCAALGMHLVLADIDGAALAAAEVRLRAAGAPEVLARLCDVTRMESVQALADAVFGDARFSDLAFLHLNAGLGSGHSAHATAMEQWRLCLGVNLYGTIHGLHAFTQRMVERPAPSKIAATSSLAGLAQTGPATGVPYVVAKHGVTLLMEHLAHELRSSARSEHVTVHLLVPGLVRTNIDENSAKATEAAGVRAPPAQAARKPGGMESAGAAAEELERTTFSPAELADGFFRRMARNDFYCIVSPKLQPESLYKALVVHRAEDIMYNRPALSQHVPGLKEQTRTRLRALREEAKPHSSL